MYIISKFHDYYDTALAMGVDKECVYNRDHEVVQEEQRRWSYDYQYRAKGGGWIEVRYFVIGFCGEFFPGVEITKDEHTHHRPEKMYLYDLDEIRVFLEDHPPQNVKPSRRKYGLGDSWSYRGIMLRVDTHFSESQTPKNVFREYHVPVFIWWPRVNKLEINPILKDYQFYGVKDAYTAFQSIHQYLSGVLGNTEKDTVGISDEDLAYEKGYDSWSFRRHSEESKKPRRRGKTK